MGLAEISCLLLREATNFDPEGRTDGRVGGKWVGVLSSSHVVLGSRLVGGMHKLCTADRRDGGGQKRKRLFDNTGSYVYTQSVSMYTRPQRLSPLERGLFRACVCMHAADDRGILNHNSPAPLPFRATDNPTCLPPCRRK